MLSTAKKTGLIKSPVFFAIGYTTIYSGIKYNHTTIYSVRQILQKYVIIIIQFYTLIMPKHQ